MPAKRKATNKTKDASVVRASVTFPGDVYHSLEQIAQQKKVSLAWVVRDASEKYIADQWPLFRNTHE